MYSFEKDFYEVAIVSGVGLCGIASQIPQIIFNGYEPINGSIISMGLGVNLYSDKETLIEQVGVEYLNVELLKKSNYYNDYIIGDDYYDMINSKVGLYEDKD